MANSYHGKTIVVYCASSSGRQKAFHNAAISMGQALASANCPLVYGGGAVGIMGIVSTTVLKAGGKVTGIIPYAMLEAGGEGSGSVEAILPDSESTPNDREKLETIVVDSMHDRKIEMAQRASAFVALPGGFGTFEEVLEVTTWNQLGIHNKPVVVLNVLSYFEPLRELIRNGLREGFIQPMNENLIIFVDGPSEHKDHETYNWGEAALQALDEWHLYPRTPSFNWRTRKDHCLVESALENA